MKVDDEIQQLIDEISFSKSNAKNYEVMKAEDISKEFREIMRFEQESFKKIEEFERTCKNQDFVEYAKMICRNTTGREIAQIQEIYLKKIDEEYLNSK
jgi:hypothetical protein